jgi:hypothetical protein
MISFPGSRIRPAESSAFHHVNGLQALLSLGDFELDLVPVVKDLETFLFNG